MKRAFCMSLLCSMCLLAAPDAVMTAPRLGYVFEAGPRALRPLEGVPGASLLGPTLDTGFPITDAVISADQSYALVITAESGSVCVLAFSGTSSTRVEIPGATAAVERLALSPSGRSAAVYNPSQGLIQVIRGLPAAPFVDRELRVHSLERMAVSDDARFILVSGRDELSPVLAFGDGEAGIALPVSGPASAMAFRPQSHDALIAAAGRITFVHESDTGREYQLFADGTDVCVGLGFSRGGDRFFAAYASGVILNYAIAGGNSSSIDCHCVPVGLQPMSPDSVFRLTTGEKEPLLLLDGANHRVVFVAKGDQ